MTDTPVRGSAAARITLIALAYAIVAWLALKMAVPPGFATPLFPSAGIALAATLAYGRVGLLGAGFGSVAVNLAISLSQGPLTWPIALLAAAIGAGAALQALVGAALIRRYVAQPLILGEPRDVAIFFLVGAPLACVVSASVGTAALTFSGAVPVELAASNWWNWWVGDTLGVLIAAPAVLTLIGQPALDWRRRRLTVALPLLVTTLFLAAATLWAAHSHEARLHAAFERDAWSLANSVEAGLRAPQDALTSVHSLLSSHPRASSELVATAAAPWLKAGSFIQAIGWSEHLDRSELPAFEADARAGGLADYRVFDRPGVANVGADVDVVALRFIEPKDGNRGALGVNALSIPAARAAILQTAASGQAVASAGFRLTQTDVDETGVVLYRAVYDRTAPGPARWRGVAFVTLRLDAMVSGILQAAPQHLRWCLTDADLATPHRRLAGPKDCHQRPAAQYGHSRPLTVAGREWSLTVAADRSALPGASDTEQWLFSLAGLAATTLLGALLLVVSGRQRRFELAVRERTNELELTSRALREGKERLSNTLNHLPVGVFQAELDGGLRDANPSLLAMLDLPSEQTMARKICDLVHPDDLGTCQNLLRQVGAEGAVATRQRLRLRTAAGADRHVQMTLSPLRSSVDAAAKIIGVVEDITERRQLEVSERARLQAEAANRAKSEFVGRMSHELRTPLNAMLGFSQLLEVDTRPALATHQRNWAAQVQTAGWHLLAMINDTLDLSMIEAGAVPLAPVQLDLASALRSAQDLVAEAAERRHVRVDPPAIEPGAEYILGDPTRVTQVLTNLLSNAVKYNRERGRLRVTARVLDGGAEIGVHDEGAGMTADQLEHLFEPFNRLGHAQSAIEGTGIGLVISRRLAELMGGSLTASSVPGQGSTFLLRLPLAAAPSAPAPSAPDRAEPASYPPRRVHYVEDNQTNVGLLRNVLLRRPQIELTVSLDGATGLADIQRIRPDLILLDMHLPDIDGVELLRRLKADATTAAIPVLVLSADATRDRIDAAMRAGAFGYQPKPLGIHALLAALDALLIRAADTTN